MLQDLALAVELQALDRKIASLEKEIATLPVHIAEIEKKLDLHKRRLEAGRAAHAANLSDRKKLEGEIQIHEQKTSKLKGQMLDAKTNEQYRAFQNEIDWCGKEIRKLEDRILELMEQSEPLEKNIKIADANLKVEQRQVDAEKKSAQERTSADQAVLAEANTQRAAIVARMDPKLYPRYEYIRKKNKGVAVADATDGRCDACMISLRPQFYQDLKAGQEVLFCELCGRILTYNPAVSFENNIAPSLK